MFVCACTLACGSEADEATNTTDTSFASTSQSLIPSEDWPVSDAELRPARAAAGDIASNGALALVVSAEPGLPSRLMAMRVAPDGAVLDSRALVLGVLPGGGSVPRAASNGEDFLVTWSAAGFVHAVRVSAKGDVAAVHRVGADLDATNDPVGVAWNGSNYLIAWASQGELYAARVTPRGSVIDPTPIALGGAAGAASPAVTAVGTSYWLAWTAPAGAPAIHGARLDGLTGELRSPANLVLADGGGASLSSPVLASKGGTTMLAWTAPNALFARRFDSAASPLDPEAGLRIASYAGGTFRPKVALTASDRGFFAVWDEAVRIKNTFMDRQVWKSPFSDPTVHQLKGAVLGLDGAIAGDVSAVTGEWLPRTASGLLEWWHPRVVFDGERCTVHVLGRDCNGPSDCPMASQDPDFSAPEPPQSFISTEAVRRLYWLSSAGEAQGDVRLATTVYPQQRAPHIAASSARFGALFTDDHDHANARGVLTTLDLNGRELTSASARAFMDTIAVNNDSWLLSGTLYRELEIGFACPYFCAVNWPFPHTQLATNDGTIAPAVGFPGTERINFSATTAGAAASDGTDFGVLTWFDAFGPSKSLGFWKVKADGTFDGTARHLWNLSNEVPKAALLFAGEHYIAVWTNGNTVQSGRIARDGSALDPEALTVSVRDVKPESLRVASDGSDFFAVWLEQGTRIWGSRIASNGAAQGVAFAIESNASPKAAPLVVYEAPHYVVVWRESDPQGATDLRALRLTRSGRALDRSAIRLTSKSDIEGFDAAAAGHGSVRLVYDRFDVAAGARRIRTKSVNLAGAAWLGNCSASAGGASSDSAGSVAVSLFGLIVALRRRRNRTRPLA
ncbi:MAG TPA: hypothetical protein VK524_20540 [Polyangiaceae bacterium]|nr:hypothetical protein [Polyangiaceae bacterium]